MPRFSPLCLLLAGLLLTAPLAVAPVLAQEEPAAGEAETGPDGEAESARPAPPGRTGLPLPRFVTLRADEVHLDRTRVASGQSASVRLTPGGRPLLPNTTPHPNHPTPT